MSLRGRPTAKKEEGEQSQLSMVKNEPAVEALLLQYHDTKPAPNKVRKLDPLELALAAERPTKMHRAGVDEEDANESKAVNTKGKKKYSNFFTKKSQAWTYSEKRTRRQWDVTVAMLGSEEYGERSDYVQAFVEHWFQYPTVPIDRRTIAAADVALQCQMNQGNTDVSIFLVNSLCKFVDESFGQPKYRTLFLECDFVGILQNFMSLKPQDVNVVQCGLVALSTLLGNHKDAEGPKTSSVEVMTLVVQALQDFKKSEDAVAVACDALMNLLVFNREPCSKKLKELQGPRILRDVLSRAIDKGSLLAKSSIVSVLAELSVSLAETLAWESNGDLLYMVPDAMVACSKHRTHASSRHDNTATDEHATLQAKRFESLLQHGFLFLSNVTDPATSASAGRRRIRRHKLRDLIEVAKKEKYDDCAQENFLSLFYNLLSEDTFDDLRQYEKDIRAIVLDTLQLHPTSPGLLDFSFDLISIFSGKIAPKPIGEGNFFAWTIPIMDSFSARLEEGTDDDATVVLGTLCSLMKALAQLLVGHPENWERLIHVGGLGAIARVMRASPVVSDFSDIQEHGCDLLACLIQGNESALMELLRPPENDSSRPTMDHIQGLARSNVDNIREKFESSLLPELCKQVMVVMKATSRDDGIQAMGCDMLVWLISTKPETVAPLVWDDDAGMMNHLTQLCLISDNSSLLPKKCQAVLRALFDHDGETVCNKMFQAAYEVGSPDRNPAYSFVTTLRASRGVTKME
ncbi:expressed unknown protein [Seminavis robusta]|uniref:Uncharacterized protein n=1 Tax=Seminavis robusta TaxID=568900 RepID=A0A9N8HW20_9STRA|nr:expressed unknown protein [Seminavis robusta]|eukprot:Sro1585_g284090.1 n/a (745) ;mRNA; r:9425-11659